MPNKSSAFFLTWAVTKVVPQIAKTATGIVKRSQKQRLVTPLRRAFLCQASLSTAQ
jgi:hypothetical protein